MLENSNMVAPDANSRLSRRRGRKDLYILLGLWVIITLQYGAIVFLILIFPIVNRVLSGFSRTGAIDSAGVCILVAVFLMLVLGLRRMRASLQPVRNQMVVEQCISLAAVLALPSMYVYGLFGNYLTKLRLDSIYPIPDVMVISIALAMPVFGYYIPFILLALWVKYKHRTDEF